MEPVPSTLHLDATNPSDITRAALILREGGTVAFPTETVYGLGANALNPTAIEKIFQAKQRPHWDPLIVHIADESMLPQITQPLTKTAHQLTERFWPGPLTLLLPRTPVIPDIVTAGRPLVGVRIPAHPVALALIRAAGLPIAAPSANTFGHTSPTTAAHVLADLDGRIDAILDGGPTTVGLESTVAEPTESGITVYRPGAVTLDMLDQVAGYERSKIYELRRTSDSQHSLPSPGLDLRHYAPRAELILSQIRQPYPAASQGFRRWIDLVKGGTLGVMLPDAWDPGRAPLVFHWGPWDNLDVLAQRLFDGLRTLDDLGATKILCPMPGSAGLGLAIQDRLEKAARAS